MEKRNEIFIVDRATGEIFEPKKKKLKRTEEFYMTTMSASIDLAKMKLSGMEHSILLYLQGLSDYDNFVPRITQAFLAKELDVTEATISNGLKHLTDLGLLHKVPMHGTWQFRIDPRVSTRGKVKG